MISRTEALAQVDKAQENYDRVAAKHGDSREAQKASKALSEAEQRANNAD